MSLVQTIIIFTQVKFVTFKVKVTVSFDLLTWKVLLLIADNNLLKFSDPIAKDYYLFIFKFSL